MHKGVVLGVALVGLLAGMAFAQPSPNGAAGGVKGTAPQAPSPRAFAPPTNGELGQSVTQLREENGELRRRLEALEARLGGAEQKLQRIPVPAGTCGSTGTWNLLTLRDVPNEKKWSTVVPVWQDCAAPPPR